MGDFIGDVTKEMGSILNKAGTSIFNGIADLISIANKELTPVIAELMFTAFNVITEFIIYGIKKVLLPLLPFIGGLLIFSAIAVGLVIKYKYPHNDHIETTFNSNWNPNDGSADPKLPAIEFTTYIEYMKIKAADAVPWLVTSCLFVSGLFLLIAGVFAGYVFKPKPPKMNEIIASFEKT